METLEVVTAAEEPRCLFWVVVGPCGSLHSFSFGTYYRHGVRRDANVRLMPTPVREAISSGIDPVVG